MQTFTFWREIYEVWLKEQWINNDRLPQNAKISSQCLSDLFCVPTPIIKGSFKNFNSLVTIHPSFLSKLLVAISGDSRYRSFDFSFCKIKGDESQSNT